MGRRCHHQQQFRRAECAQRGRECTRGGAPRPWSAEQAAGEPNTLNPGDAPTAWAPEEIDAGVEWLQVNYKRPAVIGELRIRESYHPGAISKVAAVLKDKDKGEIVLWEGTETPAGELCDF